MMLQPVRQFFESLPDKQCSRCGTVMEEQSECYMHVCRECNGETVYSLPFEKDRSREQ